MSSSWKPSTLMPVWNWGTLLSLSSACLQSHCSHAWLKRFTSANGAPRSHPEASNSSGNSATASFVFKASIFSCGTEIWNGSGAMTLLAVNPGTLIKRRCDLCEMYLTYGLYRCLGFEINENRSAEWRYFFSIECRRLPLVDNDV